MKAKDFYRHKAWKIFTKYVLLFYSKNNVVYCFTCGKWMLIDSKESCSGHLIKVFDGNSSNFATALDFYNTGPQCNTCNRYHGGRPDIMYQKLVELHGQENIDKLYQKKKLPFKLDSLYLEAIYQEYKEKYKKLKELKK